MTSSTSAEGGGHPAIALDLRDPVIFPLVSPDKREAIGTLWALNARLAEMAVSGKEPALRQIRIRWWHDQIEAMGSGQAVHDPLLRDVADHVFPHCLKQHLLDLADTWGDAAVSDTIDSAAATGAPLFAATAQLLGDLPDDDVELAGRGFALLAASQNVEIATMREQFCAAALQCLLPVRRRHLPKPLAALTGLATGIARRGGERSRLREQLVILRIGVIGG
jgi:15-cis-phytoene synthase